MTRQTIRDPQTLTSEERAEYDSLAGTRKPRPDGSIGGPFDPWLLNPELSRRLRGLGGMLWERTSLDRGIVELAISVTGWYWRANVEWASHAPRAVEYGIPQSVIDDVFEARRPTGAHEHTLTYDVCLSMHEHHRLPGPLYSEAVAAFGERGLAEMMAVIGYYTLVSMTLNAFEVQVAPGQAPPFERPLK
jgi:4-carboxymuconolactone decarboxylase